MYCMPIGSIFVTCFPYLCVFFVKQTNNFKFGFELLASHPDHLFLYEVLKVDLLSLPMRVLNSPWEWVGHTLILLYLLEGAGFCIWKYMHTIRRFHIQSHTHCIDAESTMRHVLLHRFTRQYPEARKYKQYAPLGASWGEVGFPQGCLRPHWTMWYLLRCEF